MHMTRYSSSAGGSLGVRTGAPHLRRRWLLTFGVPLPAPRKSGAAQQVSCVAA